MHASCSSLITKDMKRLFVYYVQVAAVDDGKNGIAAMYSYSNSLSAVGMFVPGENCVFCTLLDCVWNCYRPCWRGGVEVRELLVPVTLPRPCSLVPALWRVLSALSYYTRALSLASATAYLYAAAITSYVLSTITSDMRWKTLGSVTSLRTWLRKYELAGHGVLLLFNLPFCTYTSYLFTSIVCYVFLSKQITLFDVKDCREEFASHATSS